MAMDWLTDVRDQIYDLRRKWFGTFELDDPRIKKAEAPYTFYLPPPVELEAIEPGDHVKLMFRSVPDAHNFGCERMWVQVCDILNDGRNLSGTLDNEPIDIPQLEHGTAITFKRHHIIDIDWQTKEKEDQFASSEEEYFDRCFVDTCVLDDGVPVSYIFREEPEEQGEEDRFPDTGWRIRGDFEKMTEQQIEEPDLQYVAVGLVLNLDDSWLPLIDAPVGSAYTRNPETGKFEPDQTE